MLGGLLGKEWYSDYNQEAKNALYAAKSKNRLAEVLNAMSLYCLSDMLQRELKMKDREAVSTAALHPSFTAKPIGNPPRWPYPLFQRIADHLGIK